MESTNTPAIKAAADDDAMIVEAVNKAKVHCVHPTADTTKDIGRVVLAAERSRVAALATPAIQAVAPIPAWREQLFAIAPEYEGKGLIDIPMSAQVVGLNAEVKALRAALGHSAAVPAQQPTDLQSGSIRPSAEPAGRQVITRIIRDVCELDYADHGQSEDMLAVTVGDLRVILERNLQATSAPVPRVGGDTRLDELVRELYNFQGGRHFAVRLEKLIAAPAAPVAPDLASLTRWEFGFEAPRQDKFGDYVLLADVERLLSHPAQAPVEPVSENKRDTVHPTQKGE